MATKKGDERMGVFNSLLNTLEVYDGSLYISYAFKVL